MCLDLTAGLSEGLNVPPLEDVLNTGDSSPNCEDLNVPQLQLRRFFAGCEDLNVPPVLLC